MTKTLLVIVGVLLLAGLLYLCAPFVGCWYNQYRFERYVHVEIGLPSCGEESPERASHRCRYIFSFGGADGPEAIQFAGAELNHSYNQDNRTYIVSGVGSVSYGKNVIQIASTNVLFKNQSLPRGTQPSLVFVRNDGQLVSGYCDISW